MPARERAVSLAMAAAATALSAVAAFLLPWNREFDPLLAVVLVVVFALLAGVTFEIGRGFATPDQVALVPLVFLMPLPLVAPLVALGYMLCDLPAVATRRTHPDRLPTGAVNASGALGAAVAIAIAGPDTRGTAAIGVLVIALAAQWLAAGAFAVVNSGWAVGRSARSTIRDLGFVFSIDALLWPFGALVAIGGEVFPAAVLAPLALGWLFHAFSRERSEREAAALELNRAYRGTVTVLSEVVETDDSYTAEHCRSVVSLAEVVADEMGLPLEDRQELEFAALLHDVGKLAIPREILDKPAALTPEEFEVIKTHTLEGERILSRVGGLLARVGAIVRSCHERWDGHGYPDGLAGDEIPLAARVVFCCDAYNAMTTDRPYRRSIGSEAALREIAQNAGTQFDPRVAGALRAVIVRGAGDEEAERADVVRAVLSGV